MSLLSRRSAKVLLIASGTVALGLYALSKKGSSHLIQNPDSLARRFEKEADPNDQPEYDIVIIGGGTAGCVLASRLSEDPNVRVLLLEAGGSSRHDPDSQIPAAYGRLMHSSKDYDLWTEPQINAENVKKYWPRAKMLGGCSAMNAQMFHAGAPTDYDEWADGGQEGAKGWSYQELRRYFLKFENFAPHARYPSVDVSKRGTGGPVRTGYFGYMSKASSKWIESCVNMGIPLNPDVNTPAGTLGVTKVLTYIDDVGRRVSTETAYLTPEVLRRPNLKVAVDAHVTRIIFDTAGSVKKAVGVEFSHKAGGPQYRVRVKKEVVLAAGAIHSPHILLLSGVGPKEHLAEHGIPVVHDLPGVGQNLQDHAVVNTRLNLKAGHSIHHIRGTSRFDSIKTLGSLARWKLTGGGPLSTNAGEAAAFVRTDDAKLFPPDSYQIKDESSSLTAPDIEVVMVPMGYTEHGFGYTPPGSLVTMGAVLLRPQSRGTIRLKSANPFDAPLIDPKYLDSPNDLAVLVRAVKLLIRIANTEPFASAQKKDDNPLLDHNLHSLSDAELEAEVRKRIETLYHPTSTCRMAELGDGGVVDPYLRVYGLENVRVADASIFPRIPAGHTTAPAIAVGEKASDMIKQSLKESP
ncbi:alcohol oxidase [Gautieria morchelliformis]|nr:alcohol oxidase [Gautieria morchelliformis]